jgi:hypothetical protein
MIRILAVLILTALALAAPAQACSTKASSTFCAEGWIAQPVERPAHGQDPPADQPGAWPGEASGPDPSFGEGIYVEGAVTVDDPMNGDDGEL